MCGPEFSPDFFFSDVVKGHRGLALLRQRACNAIVFRSELSVARGWFVL